MPTDKLGQPCWYKENVDQAVRTIARTDEEGIDYFLASHSPINNIRQEETGEEFTEETLFFALFNSQREVLALIHGDPGTGKSHLIHWLKLRTEDALKQKALKKIRAVLIQRRPGGLKTALEQMIEQLGEDFSDYLSPVQQALSKISSDTAREILVNSIGLELSQQRRADKNRKPLPPMLKNLGKVCHSQGFRDWLCRENGLINEVVKHLTEKRLSENGEVEVEEESPSFTSNELLPDVIYRKRTENTQEVLDLIDEFEYDLDLAENAATYFNEVLPDAIREMTGLGGTNLRDIFDRIRKDLKIRGETLALFIEDVSVMASLDEEVFTAVEPQTRNDLCRMIAVLGSTNEGWNRLPDNQKQRVTHPISLGEKATVAWQNNPEAVAKFTARYLNTVRLTNEEIASVAAERRDHGGDITISACNKCPVREECHPKFGKVQIGSIEVGLYPLTLMAPQRLLDNLSDKSAAQKNARGLLTRILLPVLDDNFDSLKIGSFPNANKFAVSLYPLPFWAGFKQKYCGGWSDHDVSRLEFLAQAWVYADNADDLAAQLLPLLKPLGFRDFSRTTSAPVNPPASIEQVASVQPVPETVKQVTSTRLNKILQSLDNWYRKKEKLHEDVEIRKLVADLIRNSIIWEDITSLPSETWKNLIGGDNYAFVKIDDQFHSPQATTVFVDFPRDEETRDLIESLVQFRYAGNRSWDFEHGEHHKRVVAQWLRRNCSKVIGKLQPSQNLDTNLPVKSAVQILSTSAIVRQRTKLPTELPELLKSVISDNWTEEPVALSSAWKSLLGDMYLRHKDMLRFVTNELNIPQGRTGGINFINAIPALDAALDFASNPRIEIPSEEYLQSHWKSRFGVFQNKGKYNNFVAALDEERKAVVEIVDEISFILRSLEYETENLPDTVTEFCSDLNDLIKAQTEAKMPHPFQPFDELKARKVFTDRKDVWRTAVRTAQEVIASREIVPMLRFDPRTLKEAESAIKIAVEYIAIIEKEVAVQNEVFKEKGDPVVLADNLLNALEKIEGMRA